MPASTPSPAPAPAQIPAHAPAHTSLLPGLPPVQSAGTGGHRQQAQAAVRAAARYDNDAFVARYAAVWAYGVADPDRTSEPYYQRVLSVALPDDHALPRSVLEVGCGPGRLIADLASRAPHAQCTAVDAAGAMVELARAILHTPQGIGVVVDPGDFGFAPATIPTYGRPDVRVQRRRLEDLEPGGGYDLVVASHLLDRVNSPVAALEALAALTAPGGCLTLTCAFNYERRHQWVVANGADIADRLTRSGLHVEVLDDDVSYRERLDIRGTVTEHRVAVLRARRPGPAQRDPTD